MKMYFSIVTSEIGGTLNAKVVVVQYYNKLSTGIGILK